MSYFQLNNYFNERNHFWDVAVGFIDNFNAIYSREYIPKNIICYRNVMVSYLYVKLYKYVKRVVIKA